MPRPLPPGGQRRRAVPLRLSEEEEGPVREIAETLPYVNGKPNLSAAIRILLAEAIEARGYRGQVQGGAVGGAL